ncbi:MAG: hypothetical protein ACI4RH_09170, partial [Huintestinicola sp.]
MSNAKFPDFVRSTEYRRELGLKRKRAIKKMYSDIAKETENKINAIQRAGNWTGTTVLQMKQLRDLQKSIDDSLKNISAQIEKDIVSDMKKVAEVTCSDVAGMMKRIGVNVGAAYAHVPELAVKNIVSGNLYGQRWNFSTAVWGDYRKASGDLAQIVARGLAQNRPIYDIAKDLEKYVNPNVRKDFDWSRRYPGSKKKVDYNAYRLAQTMSTHAHQQAVILSCKDDPLIDGVEWRSSGGKNVCPLCEQRNGEVFPLDKCPMDHPMGACILVPHFKGTKIDEKTGKLIEPDFHSEAAKVDGDDLRKQFEAEKARLRAEREAKKAASVNNTASSGASANKASEKLAQMQKASDELGKAVKDLGKSVDGFEKAVGNLQNAAKGLTSGGGYSKMATISSNDWSQALPKVHTKSELDELCSYAKERGIKIYNPTAFDGDSNVLRKQIDTIYGIKTEYNINSKITVTFANMLDDDFAETINNTIYFNKKVLRDATITNLNLNADNQLAATDFTGISVHEMGHIISRKYGEKGLDIAKKAYY